MAVHSTGSSHYVSPWTVGFVTLAGSLMLLGGVFHIFQGLVAVFNGNFFIAGPEYIFKFNVVTWGWIHMIMGAIMAFAGVFVFSGQGLARGIGIFLALISAIANFFYIPYYPIWSIVTIAIDIGIIWALAAYGPEEAAA